MTTTATGESVFRSEQSSQGYGDVDTAEPRNQHRVMTTSHATDLWLGELERLGHSTRTIDTYRRLLDKLADRHPLEDVSDLSATLIRRFLDEQARLKGGGRKSAATVAQNVTIVCGLFDWLTAEGIVDRNPTRRNGDRILSRPRQVAAEDNDNVTTVSGQDVARLLQAAQTWPEKLAVTTLAYLGPRRRALSNARITDYNADERTLTFREKGGKTIQKPVPDTLADLIDAAIAAGKYVDQDYLVPGGAEQRRPGDRDDRIIWRIVTRVAARAGVDTHVHALRAAFAVHFLEEKPGELVALQKLMGHRRLETTLVYLRRLNRRQAMETVRDLGGYGESEIRTRVAPFDTNPLSRRVLSATQPSHQNAGIGVESLPASIVLDRQPSINDLVETLRPGRERAADAPRKAPSR